MTASKYTLDRSTREYNALRQVATTLAAPLDLPDLLAAAMRTLAAVLPNAEVGVLMMWDAGAGVFRPVASFGYNLDDIRAWGFQPGESVTGKVFDDGVARLFTESEVAEAMRDLRSANRATLARALGGDELPRSTLAAPLCAGDRKLGVLVLEIVHRPEPFTAHDLEFLQTLADLIALAVDRDRWEKQAAEARDARQADRLRSEVLATLSHELRTQLAAIKGYSTALLLEEMSWPDEKRREFLRAIDAECDNVQAMVNDILDSSLMDVGRLDIERQPVRLPRLARQVADEMSARSDIHHIVLDFTDFPLLDADPRRIKQVLRNLLDNAIKYSPEGGLIVVRGEVRPASVVVSIADQGIGISPEDMILLFNKFFRAKLPAGYHIAGTGLGLPVARAIVEAHGGRIWVESKLGQGTTFYFSLPREGLSAQAEENA